MSSRTKLLFLADVHLYPRNPSRAEMFFDFLARRRAEAEAIYILGDLFDYWFGPKQARRPAWRRSLERLGDVARGGPAIRILGGNRDYLLDAPTLAPFGLESAGLEDRFERDGLRFCLVHGDHQYPQPWYAQIFLRWIQGRFMRGVAHTVPWWMSTAVAETLRRWRRLVSRKDAAGAGRYDPAAFLPLFEAGADVVICGHNHWAFDYSAALGRPGCRLFALGPWRTEPSYLEYAEGAFRLVDPRLRAEAGPAEGNRQ